MYVQGVSTSEVTDILVKPLGPEVSISSTQVSRAAEQLDAGLAIWRERPLDEMPYVFLDARYERCAKAGGWSIFNAPDKAERLLKQAIEFWAKDAPKLAQWAEQNLAEGFSVFDLPLAQRVWLCIVAALLAECDEEWMTGKIYLNLKD